MCDICDKWETLHRSVQTMCDNSKRFADDTPDPAIALGYAAQYEVLRIVLNEMTTIEASDG